MKSEDGNSDSPKRKKPTGKDSFDISDPATPINNQVDKKYLKKKLSQLFKGVLEHKVRYSLFVLFFFGVKTFDIHVKLGK